MHELSLATSLIELACEHAAENGASRVTRLRVRLGVLAAVRRALYFCFEPAARGTACEGAVLEIDEVPLSVLCPACDAVKTPSGLYNFRCPTCGTPTPRVVTGREMQLVSVELDIPEAASESPPSAHRSDDSTSARP
ncbi:MAG: hydrogenase maturation nickel metallochaperone HypA [Proteobacteria bacterium]|nr:hydrogenase maturation nickel metallochaperone HypA [Pseudomonadota bacterium]